MPPKTTGQSATATRSPLTAERVIRGAVALADEIGLHAFTIRRLATALDVKPMTIYHHVPNKEAIIDGMVDLVFGEIDLLPADTDWRSAIAHRSRSLRQVLACHPWVTPLMDSRTSPGPATLRHHDAVLGCLRNGGFSLEMTAHAYALVDAYLYGFALQEAGLPATTGDDMTELAGSLTEQLPPDAYPHLVELTTEHVLQPGYDFGDEFDFGLDLILDGLAHSMEGD